jgi:hypothetical protein
VKKKCVLCSRNFCAKRTRHVFCSKKCCTVVALRRWRVRNPRGYRTAAWFRRQKANRTKINYTHLKWTKANPHKVREARRKYRVSEKGKASAQRARRRYMASEYGRQRKRARDRLWTSRLASQQRHRYREAQWLCEQKKRYACTLPADVVEMLRVARQFYQVTRRKMVS